MPGFVTSPSYEPPSSVSTPAPLFDASQPWLPSSAQQQQLQDCSISFNGATSFAQHHQYQAKESLCQDLFNVGTTDPATNHVRKNRFI